MSSKHRCLLVLLTALASLGASYRTANFTIEAPNEDMAREVGDKAEFHRKQIALRWLGEEMPTWGRRCPIHTTVTMNGPGGATEFEFDDGAIRRIRMHIRGSADYLLANVLPHEVSHTVLAYYFRQPMPRWADEGCSVLAEEERVRSQHEEHAWTILQTPGRAIPLRRLLGLMGYPRDVMVLYAQGYSLARFLLEWRNHKTLLAFVSDGMEGDWDQACEKHYRYENVEAMEAAWVKWVSAEKRKRRRQATRRRLEKEFEILTLESQLLQLQLKPKRQADDVKSEHDRLIAQIRRARRTLKELPGSAKAASLPTTPAAFPTSRRPVPISPPILPVPVFFRSSNFLLTSPEP